MSVVQLTEIASKDMVDGTNLYTKGDRLICTSFKVTKDGVEFLNNDVVVGRIPHPIKIEDTLQVNFEWECRVPIEGLPEPMRSIVRDRVNKLLGESNDN